VLDTVAPITAILQEAAKGSLTTPKATDAAKAALILLGNAISKERRKKIAKELNKHIVPLVELDNIFDEAAPNLFGDGFENKVKGGVETLKCLRRSTIFNLSSRGRTSNFFQRGHSSYQARGSGNSQGSGVWQRHLPKRQHPKEAVSKSPKLEAETNKTETHYQIFNYLLNQSHLNIMLFPKIILYQTIPEVISYPHTHW
jgi:hypothetical protein